MDYGFYLCTQQVVDFVKDDEKAIILKPFKSGFESEENKKFYVAYFDFDKVNDHYNEVLYPKEQDENNTEEIDFWCRECVPGTMDELKIDMKRAAVVGLFREILDKLDISAIRNQAYTICNLANREGITPVELINKYL